MVHLRKNGISREIPAAAMRFTAGGDAFEQDGSGMEMRQHQLENLL